MKLPAADGLSLLSSAEASSVQHVACCLTNSFTRQVVIEEIPHEDPMEMAQKKRKADAKAMEKPGASKKQQMEVRYAQSRRAWWAVEGRQSGTC